MKDPDRTAQACARTSMARATTRSIGLYREKLPHPPDRLPPIDPIEPKLELPRLLDPILVPKVPVLESGPNEPELFAGKPVVGPEELGMLGAARSSP